LTGLGLMAGGASWAGGGDLPVVGRLDTTGTAMRVAGAGDLAFVASWELEIIDVSVPSAPRKLGGYQPAWAPQDVIPAGHLVYVLPYTGVEIVDLSNPEAPRKVGGYEGQSQMGGLALADEHLYVAALNAGLRVLDVSNPGEVQLAGAFTELPQRTSEVAISGNLACVAVGPAGIRMIDVSNPADPQLTGSIDALDNVFTVSMSGEHAYVGDGHSLQVIDISDPTNPRRVGGCALKSFKSFANDVAVSGDFVYVAAQAEGLVVVDVSDPTHPTKVAGNASFNALGVAVEGDRVYVAADTDGLLIFDAFPLPRVSARTPQSPGSPLTLTVSGRPGHHVQLQRSNDLRRWETFHELTLGEDPTDVEETEANLPSHRFYRAVKE
ncbi:MAG: hypothetical protein KDM81_18610, partial [Verrucomicrobiae bacterium]|nr:hypothetical protein [Verrucomicrobiae bacterium]